MPRSYLAPNAARVPARPIVRNFTGAEMDAALDYIIALQDRLRKLETADTMNRIYAPSSRRAGVSSLNTSQEK